MNLIVSAWVCWVCCEGIWYGISRLVSVKVRTYENMTGIGVTVGITGLRENSGRDGGIEEPYWGPSGMLDIIVRFCTNCMPIAK